MNKIKKDRFYRSRGGTTEILSISCSQCGNRICNYQKDGTGNLHRMYLDRIFETNPDFLIPNYQSNLSEKDLPNLTCKCKNRIAVPMIYEKENRLAFRLLHGSIHKTKIKMRKTKLAEVAKRLNLSEKEVLEKIGYIFHDNRPQPRIIHLTSNDELKHYNVTCKGIGNIFNEFGEFMEYAFEVDDHWQDYSVLVKAKQFDSYRMPIFEMQEYFLTRFDSHCETQMLFGDMTCDCMQQLHMAMDLIIAIFLKIFF